jgi:microsomal dipeptidase-like Zn-dependent dipeptidase
MSALDWRRLKKESVIVDLHVHPSMQQQLFRRNLGFRFVVDRTLHGNPMAVRASFPRLRDGGIDVILSVLHVPEKGLQKDFPLINIFRFLRPDLWRKLFAARPLDATLRIMDDMERATAATSGYAAARVVGSVKALDALLSQPKTERPIAVIHAVEGGHSLGGPDAADETVMRSLEKLYQRGAVYLTLAHFYPNQVVHPCYPFPEDIARLAKRKWMWRDLTLGLTDLGKRVVARMIELGMLIDLSHCTPQARNEIYAIADASGKPVPLLATHVGAYGINPTPYNLQDWEIRRIVRDGGAIGVIFMPYWLMPRESRQGVNAISHHIRYLFDVGGEDCPAIGTDFDGFATPPDDLDNASLMGRLIQRLVVDGYSETQIKKILGGNALRAIRQGWGRRD